MGIIIGLSSAGIVHNEGRSCFGNGTNALGDRESGCGMTLEAHLAFVIRDAWLDRPQNGPDWLLELAMASLRLLPRYFA